MMKKKLPAILLVINLIVVILAVIGFLNLRYPMVGHDYSLAIPQFLDTYLHFRTAGLTIQWYTPSFGGGLPAFPDPNNSQFTLMEMLTLLVNPWGAVIISSIFYVSLGGVALYYFLNRVLKLHWSSSILGAVFFTANGFIFQRLAVGHLCYQTFPVIAILIIVLFDLSLPRGVAALVFAFVVAIVIQQAGHLLIIVFGLSFLIIIPLIYIYRPELVSCKRILSIVAVGGAVALVMSFSKISAVYSFTSFFPRQIMDNYHTATLKGLFGILLQLLGTMNLAPLLKLAGSDPNLLPNYLASVTGAMYGYWEFDMSMSPVVFGIVFVGAYGVFRNLKKHKQLFVSDKRWIAWILLLIFTWLTVEFILAKGLIYPILQKLPILSSLHVNPRFTAAFLFPLALCAAMIYDRWVARWSARKSKNVFLAINLLTLLPLVAYFMISADIQAREYDITESYAIYDSIRSGDPMTVTGIASGITNTQALLVHESNLQPYDPIFGYLLEDFHPEIHPGPIWEVSDGYYNMTNPSGYVFPEINDTRPFERIKVEDEKNMEALVNHEQPGWKIPLYQKILDWVSGLAFLGVVVTLIVFGATRFVKKFRSCS